MTKRNLSSRISRPCSSVRLVPQNVCRGGVACTLNTRYEDAAVTDYITLRHYPKTGVRYIYETDYDERDLGRNVPDAGDEIFR